MLEALTALKKVNGMRQNYTSSTTLQNRPPMYSFHINGFWRHVTMTNKETALGVEGIDQRGDRWFLLNDRLHSEHLPHIISINKATGGTE